jgi:lysyl-tRNA synthetase class 2
MTTPPEPSSDDILTQRRDKLARLREAGVNPFPPRVPLTAPLQFVREVHAALANYPTHESMPPEPLAKMSVAGRLMTRRDSGKTCFANIQDATGPVQIYMRRDDIGEDVFSRFTKLVDLGDIVIVTGTPFRTRTNEATVKVESWAVAGKALRPPPEKFHGLTDVEARYRRREVDLFSDKIVREKFLLRRDIVSTLRRVLDGKNFIEVETPLMQPLPGGAAAKPFTTHHEALDMKLYLRIAPELYLKRLIVGGLDRVYEIGRAFRNEGIDTRHNPEFTILECYQAYSDVNGMMDLAEELIRTAAQVVAARRTAPLTLPSPTEGRGKEDELMFHYRGKAVDLSQPFARLSMAELFQKHLGEGYMNYCSEPQRFRELAAKLGFPPGPDTTDAKCFDRILDEKILPLLPPAAFLFGYPAAFSPLAKADPQRPHLAERFELFIAGEEVANAYSEQNDPDVQRRHFQDQANRRKAGDEEAMPSDEEFLIALEHGMPPAGGLGIGVDRLTMILAGEDSIREVILFPLLRPQEQPVKS